MVLGGPSALDRGERGYPVYMVRYYWNEFALDKRYSLAFSCIAVEWLVR